MTCDQSAAGAFVVDTARVPDGEGSSFQARDGGLQQRAEFGPELGVQANGTANHVRRGGHLELGFTHVLVEEIERLGLHVRGRFEVDGVWREDEAQVETVRLGLDGRGSRHSGDERAEGRCCYRCIMRGACLSGL